METKAEIRKLRRPPLRERLAFLAVRSSFRIGSVLAPGWAAERALRYFVTPTRIPRPGWEDEILKSARRIPLRSGLVAYSWGQGPRALLVHGWDGRGTQMGRLATAIAGAGFEAVVVDLPGHGDSPGGLTHIPDAKTALLKVGAELGPFHAIIGHSFGAGASLYAVHSGFDARKLVYLAGPSRFTDLFDRYLDWVGISGRARALFEEKIAALVRLDPKEHYPAAWAAQTDRPALIVHDRDDEDAPFSEGEEIHRALRGSRFFATRGLGHRRILKSKEVIAEVVAFLKD